MKSPRASLTSMSDDDAQTLTDFIMFTQRNFILKLGPALSQGKISYPQFFLLAYLEEEGNLSMSSIAQIMGHSTAAATGMVDKLEQLGMLRRYIAASDRRRIIVGLTEGGRELVARMRSNIARDVAQLMSQQDHARARRAARKLTSERRRPAHLS